MAPTAAATSLLPLFVASHVVAYTNFLEAMQARPEGDDFYLEARQAEQIYPENTRLPFGSFAGGGRITIEQFVKELKKRKEAKEAIKKKKELLGNKKVGKQKTPDVRNKKNPKGGDREKQRPSSAPQKTRKSKPASKQPTTGKLQRKQKKNAKQAKASQKKKITSKKKTPLLKPSSRPGSKRKPVLKLPTPAKTKPSTAKKPIHRTKKKVVKQEVVEDDDPFNFGSSNAQTHSDHHIHHHDHLEAHKHHHKHKESHAHEHAHSNDHVHNHKHTHNHVHNHIHKHNEAHEHTAEHAHTEKHTHKHLEYIDQGGWRRRDQADPYGEGIVMEEPQELVLQEREGRNDNPRLNVKHELQKFIESYKAYNSDSLESARVDHSLAGVSPPYSAGESAIRFNQQAKQEADYAHHDIYEEADEVATKPEAFVSPLEHASPHPVEVEEISYEEYLRLQKKGPTFEEELDEYEDYQPEGFQDGYDSYEDSYPSYGPVDQLGYGTEDDHVVMPEYEGDWVDMDIDLQYDLGPEYLDYQELERKYATEGRSIPDYEEDYEEESSGGVEGRNLPGYEDYPEQLNLEAGDHLSNFQDQPVIGEMPGNDETNEDGEYVVGIVDQGDLGDLNQVDYDGWPSYEDYDEYIEAAPLTVLNEETEEGSFLEGDLGESKEETNESYSLDSQRFL